MSHRLSSHTLTFVAGATAKSGAATEHQVWYANRIREQNESCRQNIPTSAGERHMSIFIAFIICFVILGVFSKVLTTPPDAYAHLETEKQDHHGHHGHH